MLEDKNTNQKKNTNSQIPTKTNKKYSQIHKNKAIRLKSQTNYSSANKRSYNYANTDNIDEKKKSVLISNKNKSRLAHQVNFHIKNSKSCLTKKSQNKNNCNGHEFNIYNTDFKDGSVDSLSDTEQNPLELIMTNDKSAEPEILQEIDNFNKVLEKYNDTRQKQLIYSPAQNNFDSFGELTNPLIKFNIKDKPDCILTERKSSLDVLKKKFSLINHIKIKNKSILPCKIIKKMTKLLSDDFEKIENDIYSRSFVEKKSILNEVDDEIRKSLSKIKFRNLNEKSSLLKSNQNNIVQDDQCEDSMANLLSNHHISQTFNGWTKQISKKSFESDETKNSENIFNKLKNNHSKERCKSFISRKSKKSCMRRKTYNLENKKILSKLNMSIQSKSNQCTKNKKKSQIRKKPKPITRNKTVTKPNTRNKTMTKSITRNKKKPKPITRNKTVTKSNTRHISNPKNIKKLKTKTKPKQEKTQNCFLMQAENKNIESNFKLAKSSLKNKLRDKSKDKIIHALKKECDLNKSTPIHSSRKSSKFQKISKKSIMINKSQTNNFLSKSVSKLNKPKQIKSNSKSSKINNLKLKKFITDKNNTPSRKYILNSVTKNSNKMDCTIKSLSMIKQINQLNLFNDSMMMSSICKNKTGHFMDFQSYLSNKNKIKQNDNDNDNQSDFTKHSSFTLPTESYDRSINNPNTVTNTKDLNQILSTKDIISKIDYSDNLSQNTPFTSNQNNLISKQNIFKTNSNQNMNNIFSQTISSCRQNFDESINKQNNYFTCGTSSIQSTIEFDLRKSLKFTKNPSIKLNKNEHNFYKKQDSKEEGTEPTPQNLNIRASQHFEDIAHYKNRSCSTKKTQLNKFQNLNKKNACNGNLKKKLFHQKQKQKENLKKKLIKPNHIKLVKLQKIGSNNFKLKKNEYLSSKTKNFNSNFSIKTPKLNQIFQKEQTKVLNDLINFIDSPQ